MTPAVTEQLDRYLAELRRQDSEARRAGFECRHGDAWRHTAEVLRIEAVIAAASTAFSPLQSQQPPLAGSQAKSK
jgi:hypothetical protein